jgi:integrase
MDRAVREGRVAANPALRLRVPGWRSTPPAVLTHDQAASLFAGPNRPGAEGIASGGSEPCRTGANHTGPGRNESERTTSHPAGVEATTPDGSEATKTPPDLEGAARTGPGQTGTPEDPQELQQRAILKLLYDTGIRVGELVALDVDDLDTERRTLVVIGK